MNSKERIHANLKRESTDRIPIWMWYHPEIIRRFQNKLSQKTGDIETILGNDIRSSWLNINREFTQEIPAGERFTGDWGVVWQGTKYQTQLVKSPLDGKEPESLVEYRFPNKHDPKYSEILRQIAKTHGRDFGIVADVSGCIFEPCTHIRGTANLLMDMISNPKEVEMLMDNAVEFVKGLMDQAAQIPEVDVIWLGDDVGTQRDMMMSPQMWRQYLKERMRGLISYAKKLRPDWIVAYHSCGAIKPIIPDLIEVGVEVLNPIQPICRGMNPYEIKKEFGNELALLGGLDTQDLLVNGTPQQVYDESCHLIEELGKDGGFIFAGSHTIMPDVPLENIEASLRAAGIMLNLETVIA